MCEFRYKTNWLYIENYCWNFEKFSANTPGSGRTEIIVWSTGGRAGLSCWDAATGPWIRAVSVLAAPSSTVLVSFTELFVLTQSSVPFNIQLIKIWNHTWAWGFQIWKFLNPPPPLKLGVGSFFFKLKFILVVLFSVESFKEIDDSVVVGQKLPGDDERVSCFF